MHTAPYFTAFGLLAILHAIRVIRLRMKHGISLGTGDHDELGRMIRIFGNYTEYVPLGLVMLLGLEMLQAPAWYMHVCGTMLLLGRILHAIGLGQPSAVNNARKVGMVLTLMSLLLSSLGMSIFLMWSPGFA